MEEEMSTFDEIFDLKPILPEIYSTSHPQNYDHHHASTTNNYTNNFKQQQPISSISYDSNNSHGPQSILKPSSSSISSSPYCAPKLISFEKSNTLDDTAPNYNLDHEIAKDHKYYSLTSSQIINFSNSVEDDSGSNDQYHDVANGMSEKRVCSTAVRTSLQARDHLMAERKRRENLGQLFISLSKVVPGLKKLDKASLLEDAINHLKALQERAAVLEEEMSKKSSSIIDESKPVQDDYNYSSYKSESSINNVMSTITTGSTSSESCGAEIKARISDKHLLIKIHCKKQKGLMSRVPSEMEKMNLSVVDMRIMPFGGEALDITLLAEMQSEFSGTVKDVVDHLQQTIFFQTA